MNFCSNEKKKGSVLKLILADAKPLGVKFFLGTVPIFNLQFASHFLYRVCTCLLIFTHSKA